ncbi:MAG: S8/S53 family peptidase [Clostridia bacterium]|nr:S8/S53 family peptidase [Clostridia bacterium]
MKKKIILTMLSMILIVALCQNTVAFAVDSIGNITEEEIVVNNVYNKLHFYLNEEQYYTIDSYAELVDATDYAIYHASEYAILSENSRGSEISTYQITVEFDSGFMDTEYYKALMAERETITTIDGVRDFRSRLNSFSKTYHTQLIQNNMNMLNAVDYESASPVGYSPFVILDTEVENVTASSLLSLARNNQVMNISISGEEEITPIEDVEETETIASTAATASDPNTWEQALRDINAYNIVTNGTYTGEGIRIGILEGGGVCNIQNAGLIDKDIHPRPGQDTSTHATMVTSIVTQIAPDATYYVGKRMSGEGLDWFIENDCDVVNHSSYIPHNDDEYGFQYRYDIDAVFDYQIYAHCIAYVKSAGNNTTGDHTVTSPGYAFNAITVGGVKTDASGNLVHHSNSSYVSFYPIVKPNIVAKFKIMDIPYYVNDEGTSEGGGTSVAAAQVTGCIALFLEYSPDYSLFPEMILSLITANANKPFDYISGTPLFGNFDEKMGAGVINLESMIANSDQCVVFTHSGISPGFELGEQNIYMFQNFDLQVALAWLVSTDGTITQYSVDDVTTTYLTNYDLFIYDALGNIVAQSNLTYSNVEIIRFTAPSSGMYRISIIQGVGVNPDDYLDYVALSFRVLN